MLTCMFLPFYLPEHISLSRTLSYLNVSASFPPPLSLSLSLCWGNPSGVVVNVLDYDTVLSNFELQLRYPIPFRINTFRKSINFFISPMYHSHDTDMCETYIECSYIYIYT